MALVSLYAADAGAQGAFPAPLPGQTAAPAASPFPPVNGAPAAAVRAPASPSAFSSGAAPIGGAADLAAVPPPPQASGPSDACMKEFMPLREEAEKRGKLLKAASERKAPPDEVCKLITSYGAAEVKMIKYIESQRGQVRNPAADRRSAEDRSQEHRAMQQKVCGFAQQAAQQKAAAAPSLSEVLGSSAAMPEAQPAQGRQHLRHAERQRADAMTDAK